LDLRLNEFADAAQVESELARRFKGSASAREFATNTASQPGDRLQFASIRRLVEIGHTSEARAALKRLFPQGPPGASFGIGLLPAAGEHARRTHGGVRGHPPSGPQSSG